jgi:chaperone protein DnaJ
MSDDYYKLLEINRDADGETIKKAYKKLSLKWHPDRNKESNATEMFQKINEAYEVLSDGQKRHIYDNEGIDGLRGNQGGHRMNPNDIFAEMFGRSFNPFGMGGMNFSFNFNSNHSSQRPKQEKGPNRTTEIKLSIHEMMNGVEKNISFNRKVKCVECTGSGLKKNCRENTCNACNGKGMIQRILQLGPNMIQQQTSTCNVCGGKGKRLNPEDNCVSCNGGKFLDEHRMLSIHIPKGTKSGENIILPNLSDEVEHAHNAGDHILVISEESNENMKRVGYDLVIKKNILLSEALTGLDLFYNHPNGSNIKLKFNEVIKPGQIFRVLNLGFWNKDIQKNGDLIIEFNIIFPDKIEDKRKDLICKLLPKRKTYNYENTTDYNMVRIETNEKKSNDNFDYSDEHDDFNPAECRQQ